VARHVIACDSTQGTRVETVSDDVVSAIHQPLAVGILPISDFSNGHVYFLQKIPHRLGPD